jgi:flagellar biosynthesis protein FlhF
MQLKTYSAPTMTEALARVKTDLGPAAVILHTRSIRRGGLFGLGAKTFVQITAADDPRIPALRAAASQDPTPPPAPRVAPVNKPDPDLRAELTEIRAMVRDLVNQKSAAPTLAPTSDVPADLLDDYTRLISQHVANEIAADLVKKVDSTAREAATPYWDANGKLVAAKSTSPEDMRNRLIDAIASMVSEPITTSSQPGKSGPTVVALIGPTGVGKTTTIAKLAAHARLREGKRVGLITIDTYRIAAVEQLKTYAQILKAPLTAVVTPEEMTRAIEAMADMDLVLIDTAGRSQRDEPRINELATFLAAAQPDQIHLVLSATSREETLKEAIAAFSSLGECRLLFTKLDEAVGVGVILNLLRAFDLRLSYITTGQSVPDDIEPASARRVASLILGGTLTTPRIEEVVA